MQTLTFWHGSPFCKRLSQKTAVRQVCDNFRALAGPGFLGCAHVVITHTYMNVYYIGDEKEIAIQIEMRARI